MSPWKDHAHYPTQIMNFAERLRLQEHVPAWLTLMLKQWVFFSVLAGFE